MTPEGRVKAKVRRALEEFGDDIYREMPVPGGFGKSGLDFNLCAYGRWISVETKRPGEVLTERQKLRKREIERAGGVVFGLDGTENPKNDPSMQPFSEFVSYLRRLRGFTKQISQSVTKQAA